MENSPKNSLKIALLLSIFSTVFFLSLSHADNVGQTLKPQPLSSSISSYSKRSGLNTSQDMIDYDAKWQGITQPTYQDVATRLHHLKNAAYVKHFKAAPLQKSRTLSNKTLANAQQQSPTGIFQSMVGLTQSMSGGGYPSDTQGAVSTKHIVEVVNSEVRIWARVKVLKSTKSLSSMLGVVNPSNEYLFDPRIVYDSFANRWIITAASVLLTGGSRLYVAVSKTSDPTQAFYNLSFLFSSDLDFPMLGNNATNVFVSTSLWNTVTGSYIDTELFIFRKAELYTGRLNAFAFSKLPFVFAPPIVRDKNPLAYFVSAETFSDQIEDKSLVLYRGENLDDFNQASLIKQADIDVPDYDIPPNAWQGNGADKLDTGDGRFASASTQIGNSLWNVHTVALKIFSAPRFYEINTATSLITQQGFFYESASSFDFNPSIVANDNNDVFVTWNSTDMFNSDSEKQHEVRTNASGRRANDQLGMISSGLIIHTSSVALTGNPSWTGSGVQRWGDYSNVVIDPLKKPNCPLGDRAFLFNEIVSLTKEWSSIVAAFDYCQ